VKFLIDEDVAIEIGRCLQQAGHEVLQVGQTWVSKRLAISKKDLNDLPSFKM
jgi:hypothetical protein